MIEAISKRRAKSASRLTFRVCLAASFLAHPLDSHFSVTPAFSIAFLMAPDPAARGRDLRV